MESKLNDREEERKRRKLYLKSMVLCYILDSDSIFPINAMQYDRVFVYLSVWRNCAKVVNIL